jgi:hypothetical protein
LRLAVCEQWCVVGDSGKLKIFDHDILPFWFARASTDACFDWNGCPRSEGLRFHTKSPPGSTVVFNFQTLNLRCASTLQCAFSEIADELPFVATLPGLQHDFLELSSGAIGNFSFGVVIGTAHVLTVAKAFQH